MLIRILSPFLPSPPPPLLLITFLNKFLCFQNQKEAYEEQKRKEKEEKAAAKAAQLEYERVYGTITPVSQSPLKLRGLQNTPGKGGPGQSPSLKRRAVSPAIMDPRSASKTFTHSSLRSPNVTRKVIPATSAQKPPGLPSGLAKVAGTNAMTPRARPMPQQAYPPVTPASVYDGE